MWTSQRGACDLSDHFRRTALAKTDSPEVYQQELRKTVDRFVDLKRPSCEAEGGSSSQAFANDGSELTERFCHTESVQ